MRRWFTVSLIAIFAVGIAVAWRAATKEERVPDRIRICQILEQGRQCAMDRDLRGAMALVSREYHDSNGLTYQTLKLSAARALQSAEDYMVSLDAPIEALNGSNAVARAKVEVVALIGGIRSPAVRFELVATFSKEQSRRWGVFPVSRWRITSLDGLPLSILEGT